MKLVPKFLGQELVNYLKEEMEKIKSTAVLEQEVESVENLADETFKLTTNREVHYTKSYVIF